MASGGRVDVAVVHRGACGCCRCHDLVRAVDRCGRVDLDQLPHMGVHRRDVAWVTDTIECDMLYDGIIDIRCTVILVRVDGEWKVAHSHVSEGVVREM